jgi:hypothetical protein
VACANGGAIDDARYSSAVGGFSAVVYDASRYYRPVAQLMDDGKTALTIYDDRSAPIASFVERLDSSTHAVSSRMLGNFTLTGFSRYKGFSQLNTASTDGSDNQYGIYSSSLPNSGASVGLAPEASFYCERIYPQSWDNACPAKQVETDSYTVGVMGSSFVLNMLVESGSSKQMASVTETQPISISWVPPSGSGNQATIDFEFATHSTTNGQFVLYSGTSSSGVEMARTETMALPRQWTIVAYEDNALVFGDGKLVLSASAKSSDPWSVENYLFTTATTTITFNTNSGPFLKVAGGSAPVVSVTYLNGALQPIQQHLLNLTDSEDALGTDKQRADATRIKRE